MSQNTLQPNERGAYILREPKGIPDIILICEKDDTSALYKAADILAVQGYTARLVRLIDIKIFEKQDEKYRQSVLPASRKADQIFERTLPAETAQAARARILASLEENGCD